MSSKLKECPFCGGDGNLARGADSGLYMCGCLDKECRGYVMSDRKRFSPDEAIEAWNRRADNCKNCEALKFAQKWC